MLKVIQWATGNVGTRALRAVVEHPQLQLAGVWVSNPDKSGLDASRLVERDVGYAGSCADSGIMTTTDQEALIATAADCVLYMRQGTDINELCRILASGKNVVTTRGDFHHPPMMNADHRAAIEAACAAGGTSIYSTGSSPGFITEALMLPLLSLSRSLDCLTIDEFANMESRNSPDLLFNLMGFGAVMAPYDQHRAEHVKADFAASLAQLAQACGIAVDDWHCFGELSAARNDTAIAAGIIKAGTVAAQRITIEGRQDGAARLRFRANWYCSADIVNADWDLRPSGWRVQLAGDTPLDVAISFPVSPEDYAAFTPGLTAHRAVNAIAAVCAAPPGIRTTADLPNIAAQL